MTCIQSIGEKMNGGEALKWYESNNYEDNQNFETEMEKRTVL